MMFFIVCKFWVPIWLRLFSLNFRWPLTLLKRVLWYFLNSWWRRNAHLAFSIIQKKFVVFMIINRPHHLGFNARNSRLKKAPKRRLNAKMMIVNVQAQRSCCLLFSCYVKKRTSVCNIVVVHFSYCILKILKTMLNNVLKIDVLGPVLMRVKVGR